MVRSSGNGAGQSVGVIGVDAYAFRDAGAPRGPQATAVPAFSGGMLLALAMNRRARGLRGLDVLRRSQDRAPPQFS
ncbi:hypothetical protein [Blastococcus haudaquaticus]|uniref:Uncharacterized protein n=1 Tax=Blastococcus haudaquaticus TaxID=1938745 RepID=A0A286H2X5_9ACTN|nr:hypothetical protein [Blastococcus haudaquaticus]SOE02153.1 hypothetical protein SAMN06272739_3376 [Blastococcus haudaquaticus]